MTARCCTIVVVFERLICACLLVLTHCFMVLFSFARLKKENKESTC